VLGNSEYTEEREFSLEDTSWVLAYKMKTLRIYEYASGAWTENTSVGVYGLDDELSYDYLSSFQNKTVIRSSAYSPATVTAVRFVYYPFYELNFDKNYPELITQLAGITGTDGIYEELIEGAKNIKSRADAVNFCNQYVQKKSQKKVEISFKTKNPAYAQLGKTLRFQSDIYHIDIVGLITEVNAELARGRMEYEVVLESSTAGLAEYLAELLRKRAAVDTEEESVEAIETFLHNVEAEEIFQDSFHSETALWDSAKWDQNFFA